MARSRLARPTKDPSLLNSSSRSSTTCSSNTAIASCSKGGAKSGVGGEARWARRRQTLSRRSWPACPRSQLTPPGILPCQSTEQVDLLIENRETAGTLMRIAPTLSDDLPLPGRHRRRRHDQGRPPAAGKETTIKGEECPISPGEPGTWHTSLQLLDLVAEHDDLDVSLDGVEMMNPKNLEDWTDQAEEKREGQDRRGCRRHRARSGAFGYVHPTGPYGTGDQQHPQTSWPVSRSGDGSEWCRWPGADRNRREWRAAPVPFPACRSGRTATRSS